MNEKDKFIQMYDADRHEPIPEKVIEYIIPDVYPMKDAELEKFIKHEQNNKNIWRTKQNFMNRNRNISLVITKNSILFKCAVNSGRVPFEREKYIRMKIKEMDALEK